MSPTRQPSSRALRRRLVEQLEAAGALTDPAVRKAFLGVPRERFLAETAEAQGLAAIYADKAIVTRTDERGAPTSSSSQPAIMAIMLERLELAPGLRVLEIGAGTGYNAALLSTIVGDTGQVTSVELEPDLAAAATAALASGGHGAIVVTGDGREGWAPGAPYDRITVTASTAIVARPWFEQLAPGGLLQLPLHLQGPDLQAVVTLRKVGDRLRSTDVVNGGFMVLRDPQHGSRPAPPGSGLSVNEHVDGRHRSMGSLTGTALGRLGPAARRRLARLMLDEPRSRRVAGPGGGRPSPALYLSLARIPGAVAARYFRSGLEKTGDWAVAVATVDGRSLVVAIRTRAGAWRLESYGDPRADDALAHLLAEWRARGRPGAADLRVTVTYPDDGPPRTALGWRQSSTVSSRR